MSDPLSITAIIITVLQLAATATDYLRSIKNGAEDRVKLRDELRNTTYLLEMLRDRIEDAEDVVATLGTEKPMSIKSLSGPDNALVIFQRVVEDIIAQLSPQHLGQKLDDTHLRHQEDQNERIFLWFATLSFHEQHVAILESVQAGTGAWFIKHETLQNWLEGKISMIWCPGIPGAGKTRLMSIVINTLEHEKTSNNTLHTYIYCNYGRRKEQTYTALLSSLLLQVLQFSTSETVPPEVLSLYNSHKKYGTRPTSKELIDLLAKLTSPYETLFVVMDALDECTESEEETLRFLSTLRSVGSNVKILCSSRFSTTFEAYFASAEKIEIFARDEDIELFLNSEISRHPRLSKHVRADPDLRNDIIAFITGECQGMFLLAKLHLDSISTKINRKAVRYALQTLPTTLDETYSEALQRIHDQPADTVVLAEIVLLWVICAHQSLTIMQLQHMYATQELTDEMALEIDDLPDGEILTGACGGLITVDESQTIHLIHYTAKQYFERSLAQELTAARISLTKVGLTYLALPNFSSGFCTSDTAMLQRLIEYPFLDYAAKHWGTDMNVLDASAIFPYLERLFSNSIAIEMTSQAWCVSSARYSNWSQEFPRKSPALVLASAFNLPAILRHMIADGHEIEGRGTDNETALIRAAAFGHVENVRVLLQLGATVNAKDYIDETALQRAVRNGHGDVMRVLIDGGASVNNKSSNNWTSLMSAVSSGNIDAVRMLVEAGAELMAVTEWGDSAMSMAVRSGQEAIAVFLADHGAVLPHGVAGRRASVIASRRGLQRLARRLTVDYEAVAGKPLQRQSSRIASGLLAGIPWEKSSGSETEAKESNEVSFGEILEQYNMKTGFNQRYKVIQQLGQGSYAIVHLCSNKVTGVLFAVKIFKRYKGITPSNLQGVRTEIQLLRELQKHHHPNLTRLVDIFADFENKTICLLMDLAPEGELFNVIVGKGNLSEAETRKIFTQLLSAIQFLHDRGWVHRDVKPENILVMDKNLTIQLGDFGISRQIHTGEYDGLPTTLCGTPSYVAPEILEPHSKRRYGFGVDIWSCGVVLYICLCGFPPFSDDLYTPEQPYNLAQQIKMGKFDFPSPYWDTVGDAALDLIDRMLIVDSVKRSSAPDCLSHPWMCGKPLDGFERITDAIRSRTMPVGAIGGDEDLRVDAVDDGVRSMRH
ncbi:hypothetical protein N7445_010542 [Penicillium cf. griseofulvum]|nr:hypothetical protein N7445_010542 [Penicillium cf. griseofulvum]